MTEHHYIPKFYLKNFSYKQTKGKKKRYYVYCYIKKTGFFGSKEISNICKESEFYSFNPNDPNAYEEVILKKVDNLFATTLRRVVRTKSIGILLIKEKILLGEFLYHTRLRGKTIRKQIVEKGKEMDPPLTELEIKQAHVHLLQEYFGSSAAVSFMTDRILKSNWGLLHNNTVVPFITSDNPLIIQGFKHKDRENAYFPLSPNLLLIFYPETYQPSPFRLATLETINKVNMNILRQSDEIVISNNRNYLQTLITDR